MIYNICLAKLHGKNIYIIGNHKQCMVLMIIGLIVNRSVAALTIDLTHVGGELFEGHMGWFVSTQELT